MDEVWKSWEVDLILEEDDDGARVVQFVFSIELVNLSNIDLGGSH